jgi:hypothetical protein
MYNAFNPLFNMAEYMLITFYILILILIQKRHAVNNHGKCLLVHHLSDCFLLFIFIQVCLSFFFSIILSLFLYFKP